MILWTTREREAIAQRLIDNGVDPKQHGWRGELVDAMKGVLPADRWRDPSSLNEAKKWMVPLMRQLKIAAESAPPAPPVAVEEPEMTEDEIGALMDKVINRIAKKFAVAIEKELSAIYNDLHEVVAAPQQEPAPRHNPFGSSATSSSVPRKRVLLIGGRTDQCAFVQAQCPCVDIVHVAQGDSINRICLAQRIDAVVLWTNFIGHDHEKKARAHFDKRIIHRVDGGIETVSHAINNL